LEASTTKNKEDGPVPVGDGSGCHDPARGDDDGTIEAEKRKKGTTLQNPKLVKRRKMGKSTGM